MNTKKIRIWLLSLSAVAVFVWAFLTGSSGMPDNSLNTDSGMITVSAADSVSGAAITATLNSMGIHEVNVLYKTEEVQVHLQTGGKKVYYTILKNDKTDSSGCVSVKPSEVFPAAEDGGHMLFYVDISTISASKEGYIGVTTNITPGSDGLVKVALIRISASQKKITFNVNWAYEGGPNSWSPRKVLESVEVTNNNGTNVTYKHLTGAETETATVSNITRIAESIQWRKGANGDWTDLDDMKYTDWAGMLGSGAILYFRLNAVNDGSGRTGNRYSKENKIKIATTKAPNLKIDVRKLTLPIKNGMQFRGVGQTYWVTVLPFASNSTQNTTAFKQESAGVLFDPFKDNTQVKAAATSIKDIAHYCPPAAASAATSGGSISLEVRIAATSKKPASRTGVITIPAQGNAPTVTGITRAVVTSGGKFSGYQYTLGTIAIGDTLVSSPSYEYCVVHRSDFTNNLVDYSTLSWGSVKTGTVLKDNVKTTYVKLDAAKTRVTAKITDVTPDTSVILIRRKGVKGSSKTVDILASAPCMVEIPQQ